MEACNRSLFLIFILIVLSLCFDLKGFQSATLHINGNKQKKKRCTWLLLHILNVYFLPVIWSQGQGPAGYFSSPFFSNHGSPRPGLICSLNPAAYPVSLCPRGHAWRGVPIRCLQHLSWLLCGSGTIRALQIIRQAEVPLQPLAAGAWFPSPLSEVTSQQSWPQVEVGDGGPVGSRLCPVIPMIEYDSEKRKLLG